jgi:hypothetical protein
MAIEVLAERDMRGPGCSEACRTVRAVVPGVFGRSELLLHDPLSHELYGRLGRSDGRLMTGPLTIDLLTCEAFLDGERIAFTATETRIVLSLARGAGALVPVEIILEDVWGEMYVQAGARFANAHLLRVNMARLRAKLKHAAGLIVTRFGLGYRLLMVEPGQPAAPFVPSREPHGRLEGRWSQFRERCLGCKTTERPHQARGYCALCYDRVMRRNRSVQEFAP